ncbi:hypothetical protein [Serratia liquefaciens]|uniref:hypothetical protein n=1 Tax=Serratia liquefaciens TaxID=614 RepID=UPI0021833D56|nr:hypothetical protein [Serratia liquefaciens]CAI2474939.1 Uncharacterised protein [Serratia liquefaciens]
MKRLCKTVLLPMNIGIAVLSPLSAGAVTREEMRTLDAAYPPGSIVNCEAELAGNGKNLLPMTTKIRGHIISRAENLSHADVRVMFIPHGSSTATITLSYRQKVIMEENGQRVYIDPESLEVSMPVSPSSEAIVAKGFRDRLPATQEVQPYQTTEITDFPSYVVRVPGESPLYCHKVE